MLKIFCICLLLTPQLFSDKWVAFGSGVCGIVRPRDRTPMIQIEYQPDPIIEPVNWFCIRPQIGFFVNFRAASYYFGGFRFEFFPHGKFVITPGYASGIYIRGYGKNLYFPIENKSSIELAYQFRNKTRRFSAQFYHISNASCGERNPGTEMLVFSFSIKI